MLLLSALAFQGARLQPTSYASPSGRRTLVVEPNVLEGATAAMYRMRLDGVELWSVKLPLVLYDAALAEDGRAAGWARSVDQSGENGTLLAVALSSEGQVLTRVPYALTHTYWPHGAHSYFPRVEDVLLQPELGRFVFWVFAEGDEGYGDELWSHDLTTGARLARWRAPEMRDERIDLLAVRAIPATPLLLVASQHSDNAHEPTQRDARFQLLDADGRIVWSLDFAHDHELNGDWNAEVRQKCALREDPPILATAPGHFELRAVASAQRILFEVESIDDEWRVRELSRMPYEPPGGLPTPFSPTLLARVPLRSAIPADEPPGLASIEPALGRILMRDAQAKVHVFDLEGRELDGQLAVPRPETWGVRGNALVRLDAEGDVELRHENRPDGRWFEDLRKLAVAADGSFVALEGRGFVLHALEKASLSLYDASGGPLRVLALPGEVPSGSLSYQGGRVLLADHSSTLLLELSSGRRFALEFEEQARREYNALALSPDGRELWVLRSAEREFVRYALPK
ncbi:MAG: hypothetical protein ABL998_02125 [Planctomycetota bacterium]